MVKTTGSGTQPDQLDPLLERAASLIGEAALSGIPGGMEVGGIEVTKEEVGWMEVGK